MRLHILVLALERAAPANDNNNIQVLARPCASCNAEMRLSIVRLGARDSLCHVPPALLSQLQASSSVPEAPQLEPESARSDCPLARRARPLVRVGALEPGASRSAEWFRPRRTIPVGTGRHQAPDRELGLATRNGRYADSISHTHQDQEQGIQLHGEPFSNWAREALT